MAAGAWMVEHALPCRFCDLWRAYHPARPYWDDVLNGPFGARAPASVAWSNVEPTPPAASEFVAASNPPPAARCKALGLSSSHLAASPRRIQWLHIPKTGSSFGTTLMRYGCPRIPEDAAADDGAPIVSLTARFPRGARRWCDKGAFLGNLNGHEPVRYPEHRGHTVTLLRPPRARLVSECAAIENEFRRAFGERAAEPPGGMEPTGGTRGAGTGGVSPSRRVPRRRLRRRRPGGSGGGGSGGGSGGGGGGGASGGGVWRRGSVYANPFLREFLYSHGLSHRAIARLTALWNAHRALPLAECLSVEGIKGCQAKMVLGVPCAAPYALNATLLAEAARRISDDFLFVGVVRCRRRRLVRVSLNAPGLPGLPGAPRLLLSSLFSSQPAHA